MAETDPREAAGATSWAVSAGAETEGTAHAHCPAWVRDLNIWTDEGLHRDPYPQYAELRSYPIGRSDRLGGYYVISRYDDVLAVLQDAVNFSNEHLFVPPTRDPSGRRIPIELDPPEHGLYKRMLAGFFSPQWTRRFEPTVRGIVRDLLAPHVGRSELEFMSSVAVPLPFRAMAVAFGLPPGDADLLRGWDDQMRSGTSDLDARKRASASVRVKLLGYFADLTAARRAEPIAPADGLVGMVDALVAARVGEDKRELELDEMANICVTMWNASLHTTANVLGNTMVHLAARPDLRDRLVADPSVIREALEELMRYESIVAQARLVRGEVTVGGRAMRPGDHVVTLTGSAGRDAAVYEDPDSIDFDRPVKKHLMFGAGLHRCIGSHVARMELRVALEEIHATFPHYRADPARPSRRHTGLERGTESLHLLLGAA
ncbi:cytochrome P450 [Actinomadura sp. LD22]|uniref:Cytochrome P450 n=1 Tax=Actinomadura physcomitrii TaxID=2650748 RepID=A0A6I4M6A6_9ACTN|nr:cytochrome P450 [Actinomadura physcomitrii]MVZ99864.1 cytochrome P450 [Actinomadura physcomitrii]